MSRQLDRASRVALVHDQLEQAGGAERVLWALHRMFPNAPIFTAMVRTSALAGLPACDLRTTWMQRLPGIELAPRAYAALYPFAFARLDLRGFDLVISSASYFAKGISIAAGAVHICYCHTPPNFVWQPRLYSRRRASRIAGIPLRAWLRAWDRWAAKQPDVFIANGQAVADRIRTFYQREAVIVPPPIEAGWFVAHQGDEFYLTVSRLVPQKRIDLAVEACTELSLPLRVVGVGRALDDLRRRAGPTVQFLGRVADHELRSLYARAIALLLPGEEDFGIVPLEAQAAGTPVIAYDRGGATETVVEGETGCRFAPQTARAMKDAIVRARAFSWNRALIQLHAASFEEDRFRRGIRDVIEQAWQRSDTTPAGLGRAS